MDVVMIYFYSKRFRFAPSFNDRVLFLSTSESTFTEYTFPDYPILQKKSFLNSMRCAFTSLAGAVCRPWHIVIIPVPSRASQPVVSSM